jgi:hypothetical protein
MKYLEPEFVPYLLALRMKALGFDERTLRAYYKESGQLLDIGSGNIYDTKAPTFQSAFKWFREKYNLFGHIEVESNNSFYWHIRNPEQFISSQKSNTYEEAELAALEKLIEIVEQKQLKND